MKEKSPCRFITFTGRPGSGKSTIIKNVLLVRPDLQMFSGKSVTTRPQRKGDVLGEYLHVTPQEFAGMDKVGEFLWTAEQESTGYRYGTRRMDVDRTLRGRKKSVMTLVPEAVDSLREYVGAERMLSFFIHVPVDTLARRMIEYRGDEPEKAFARLQETVTWTQSLDMVIVANISEEEPPAQTATESVLKVLSKC